MRPKKNPLKLNKLQLRTLALAQALAGDPAGSARDDDAGTVTIFNLAHPHGDHVHIGPFVVSSRDASGMTNPAVWRVLARKGLVLRADGLSQTLTADGLAYDTGLSERFANSSGH